jgi:pyridoxine/pyridoxamine 5'-phosphate oxidase
MDPMTELQTERDRARAAGDPLVDLCFLATAAGGQASARTLVLRDLDGRGAGVLLSATSPKWRELEQGGCELLILWRAIGRQYRLRGELEPLEEEHVERAWRAKTHGSRLLDHYYGEGGAQSSVVASRDEFLVGVDALRRRWPTADEVPRPDTLRGVRLVATRVERWHGSPADRLHHRVLSTRSSDGSWVDQVLVP